MSGGPRFELDAAVRRLVDGRLLVGGIPPRLLRLSEIGARALDAILAGDDTSAAARTLARRLRRDGILHPVPGEGVDDPEVTAIVPVLDGGERLAALVASLASEGPVIVVDDGSRDGSAARAERAGARVLRHDSPRGPAAARNTGLAAAMTEIVAFLDADCEVTPGWRRGLPGLLAADPDLALVAPRVRSSPGSTVLAHYEEQRSPLDLGPDASLVGPGRRVSYLPAAALIGRRDTLLEVGGFDESLRFGEDVDLVWRLLNLNRKVRYVPIREVRHRPRASIAAFALQRAGYGGSAPELVARHGRAAAPLRSGRHATAIWLAVLLLGPRAFLPGFAASATLVASRGDDLDTRRALAGISLRGNYIATLHLGRVMVREWLPLGAAAALSSRRGRRVLCAAAVVDFLPVLGAATGIGELPALTALHGLDRAAYCAGMWRAMGRRNSIAALAPRCSSTE